MLIQAHCQEREKRCTITTDASNSDDQTNENDKSDKSDTSDEKMDTNEASEMAKDSNLDPDPPKSELNTTEASMNDIEMTDSNDKATETIKKESADDNVPIVNNNDNSQSNTVTSGDEQSSNKIENENTNESKIDEKEQNDTVNMETDENGNESNTNSNKDEPNENSNDKIDKNPESTTDKDDPYSRDINIDPRTYCKLGHFHLLLEDYAKGNTYHIHTPTKKK